MTSSRALELVHKLELPDDVGIQLNVVNALGDCPIAKADIIAILKDYARMKDTIDQERETLIQDHQGLCEGHAKEAREHAIKCAKEEGWYEWEMLNHIEGGKEYGHKAYKMNTQYFKSRKFSEAYATWNEIDNQMIGYPSFGEWLYMTDQELQEWLNPKVANVKACKDCGNEKCPYRQVETCWKCPYPPNYIDKDDKEEME